MAAFVFIDRDAVRSTCAVKAEVLKFLLWVSPKGGRAQKRAATHSDSELEALRHGRPAPLLSANHRAIGLAAPLTWCAVALRSVCSCFFSFLFVIVFYFLYFQMYESPVVGALAEGGNIALLPSLYLKQSDLLDQMRREILCDGDALLQADSTSASVRGNAIIAASVSLMTQLYKQVDPSSNTRKHEQRAGPDARRARRAGGTPGSRAPTRPRGRAVARARGWGRGRPSKHLSVRIRLLIC